MDPFTWMLGVVALGAYGYRRPTDVLRAALRVRLHAAGVRARRHTLPDARIHYWRGGRGEALVFVHGFGTEAAVNWQAQLVDLARDHDVLAPDLPGFGRSERVPATNCIALQVRSLRALLDDLGIARASLVGHSMGGWISLAFASAHPERVRRLVVVDAAGLRFDPDMALERALLPTTIDDVRLLIRANFRDPMRVPAFVLRDLLRLAREDAVSREALLRRLVYGDEHLDEELHAITAPTLVVWGGADALTPPALGRRIANAIRTAELVVFDDCAHSPNVECPTRFNGLLREFLGRDLRLGDRQHALAATG